MTGADEISPPAHLSPEHDLATFTSGMPVLDTWLKLRALRNEQTGASRTYVVTAAGRVVGYYAIATGAVAHAQTTAKQRRNMPDPIPVMILAQLAVDQAYQGRGLGQGLLRDAILRTLQAAEIAGIRAILVNAISDDAKRFYLRHGFVESPVAPMMLMVTVADAAKALTG